ncbi:MAG: hypothetical protein JW942_09370 [Opitutales bacterium]|nr:hypothetical protein [Opitutales bacterium]
MTSSTEKAVDHDFELALMEDIYRRDTADTRTLEALATLYTELGLIEKGLELDLRHIELEPNNPSAHYNCACSLSLSGRLDEAFERLELSLTLGFDNIEWMHKDPDLKAMRKDPRWAALPRAE